MRIRTLELGNKNICGRKIEQLRVKRGFKQSYLVEKMSIRGIKMSISSISKIEGQLRQINDYELVAIAEILEVPLSELFTD